MRNRSAPRWRLVGGLPAVLALVLVGVVPAAASAADPQDRSPVPRLGWQGCGDGFECATATVPLDHDRPRGDTIELALVRLPASDPQRRIGSLFVNPGGPGNSGIAYVRESARAVYTAEMRARFDIVGMDPRGVGASTPVRCFDTEAERRAFFTGWDVIPIGAEALAAATAKATDLAQRCADRAGWLLPHLSTADVARDLDLLRRAVGDRGLTYAGYSYGTFLGAMYAKLFPHHVRALLLDGVSDPPAYVRGRQPSVPFVRVGAHLGSAETLEEFFRLCSAAGAGCAFGADGADPRAKFATLAERLLASPLVLPDGTSMGYDELVDGTVTALYDPAGWAAGAELLEQLFVVTTPNGGASTGDGPAVAVTTDEEPAYDNVLESLFASVCSDTVGPADTAGYAAAAARAEAQAPYAGALWAYRSLPCAVWPVEGPDRGAEPWKVRLRHPALVLSTRYDPATPHRNAVRMTELLPGSRLVTVEGWGHTARDSHSACADALIERYLVDGVLPARGSTCEPGIVPFG